MNGIKIILVEDDPFLQGMYKDALLHAGYILVTANDGEEGLNMILSNPDAKLILLDLMLPKLNGIEVLREIKRNDNTNTIPVIVLTNLSDDTIVQDAMKLGANATLVKVDYTPQQIIETVKMYIN